MRPVLLWHGMGATADSLGEVAAMLQEALNTSVYSIQIGSKDEDQKYSFFDRIDRQVKLVCDYLQSDPIYSNGYDAIGFSQGGLFLRALVQSCPIKANSLITLGSPHGGVSDIPRCSNSNDVNCSLMRSIVNQGVYWSWIQQRVVQAQYFKQWSNPAYKKSNIFLPKINNELAENQEYKARLQSLSKFVMVMFTNDTQVVPKETAWFGFYNEKGSLTSIQQQPIYYSLGLDKLESEAKIDWIELEGEHLEISLSKLRELAVRYFQDPIPELKLQI